MMGSALVVTGCKCFCFDGYIYIYMYETGNGWLILLSTELPLSTIYTKRSIWCLNNSWIWISVVSKKTELQHQLMVEFTI